MTRGSFTSHGTRIGVLAAVAAVAGCGDDSDDPPISSRLAAVEAALCDHPPADELPDLEHFDQSNGGYVLEDGTVYLLMGGELYDMSDC